MGVFGPDITMCGPLWAAMQVVVCERYKKGKKVWGLFLAERQVFDLEPLQDIGLMPIVTLVQPILSVALALTMVVQGFVSVRIGVQQSRSFKDLGIAGVIAGVILANGSAWGLAVGIVACFLAYGRSFLKGDTTFGHLWSSEVEGHVEEEDKIEDEAPVNQPPKRLS